MRTSTRSALPALLTVLCFTAPLFAQSTTKDPGLKGPRATISGRITIKDKPARGIAVGLRKSALMSASDSFTKVVTDGDGVYKLTDVPPGSYLVTVVAPGFVLNERDEYRTVVASEGENVDGMNFSLVRGAVITGKLTDAEGRPVILQNVHILPAESVDGKSQDNPIHGAVTTHTDDRGIYRAFGIRPGRYKVAAGQSDQPIMGSFSRSKYKQVFHPDVTDPVKATVIEVTEGSETTKVDITLGAVTQTYSVSGRLVNGETGKPVPGLGFTLWAVGPGRYAYGRTDGRGEFVLDGVAPGSYNVRVADETSGLRGDNVAVEVIDRDVTELTIKLSTGFSVSGVVILETEDKSARSKLLEMRIEGAVRPGGKSRYGVSSAGAVAADGSFTVPALTEGSAVLSLASVSSPYPPKGFAITRIERDGVEIRRIELKDRQNVTGVKIFVGYGTAAVRGVVNVENGPLPAGARIYLRLARAGEENGPSVRNAAVDERGRFAVDGLLPGLHEIMAYVVGVAKEPKRVKQQVSLSDGVTTEVSITIDLAAPSEP